MKKLLFILSFLALMLASCSNSSKNVMEMLYNVSESPKEIRYFDSGVSNSSYSNIDVSKYEELLSKFNNLAFINNKDFQGDVSKESYLELVYNDSTYYLGFSDNYLYIKANDNESYYVVNISNDFYNNTKEYLNSFNK